MTVQELIKELNKKNKLEVTALSDENSPCIVTEVMSTGCLALDAIVGGGLPVGRITEIYGDESTGKSLIAAQVAAIAQQNGHIVAYIDTEGAVSIEIMREVGVDADNLIYTVPDTIDGEEGVLQFIQDTIKLVAERDPDKLLLVIWDSIAATSALKEMDDAYGKAQMGRHAGLISQGLRKLKPYIAKHRVCALFINQTREKIGIMFGDKTTTFGGKAIAFHATTRIALTGGKEIKNDDKRTIGIVNRAKVTKNKYSYPFREADLPIFFGHGIDDALAAFEYMKENKLFYQNGGWYTLFRDKQHEVAKFQKKGWKEVFDEHYDFIAALILGVDYEGPFTD